MSEARATPSLRLNLGLFAIVGLGLGYMTQTVVFDTFGIVSQETDGAVPAAYLVALVIMLLTALSYGKLVRVFPSAGSAFTYVRQSIHPNLGFLVGCSRSSPGDSAASPRASTRTSAWRI